MRNGNTPTGGSIHGTVTDYLGNLIRGVSVQACGEYHGACALTETNGQGNYAVTGLPAVEYFVTANPPADSAFLMPGETQVAVFAGSDSEADLQLYDASPPPADITMTYHRLNADGTPVLEWGGANTLSYPFGCASGAVSATIALNDGSGSETFNLTEAVNGGFHTGYYSIPDLYPLHGPATVTINTSCPDDPSLDEQESFNIYVDPSGLVVDQHGNPIPGATVTLLRSDNPDGPFTPVPDGSPLMSPGNRANPDTTTANGTFGWDVLTGYYQVQASKSGCTSPQDPNATAVTSRPFEVPPPMTGLRLTLECAGATPTTLAYTGPTAADTHDPITASVVLTDQASGQPVPDQNVTITFADQTCTAVTDPAGTASCTVTPQAWPARARRRQASPARTGTSPRPAAR